MVKPLSEDPNVEMTYKGVPLPQRVIEHWTSSWGELWREGVDNTLNVEERPKEGNVEVFDTKSIGHLTPLHWLRRLSDDKWFFQHGDGHIAASQDVSHLRDDLKSFGYKYIPAHEFPDGKA